MARILEFADAMPEGVARGRRGSAWPDIAAELRAAGRRAGRIDRKTKGLSKAERERATAAGLRIGLRKAGGEQQWWVELVDVPAPAGPPPVESAHANGRGNGANGAGTVTTRSFVNAYKDARGDVTAVRTALGLTAAQYEAHRTAARRDGLI